MRILITGGTGSFGRTAVKRFLDDPRVTKIIVYSRDEKKQHDMRQRMHSPKLTFIIGDTHHREAIFAATKNVDVIFHAAALKQVPTGEFFPLEMVKTNILGTQNVFDAAEANGVKKVILLSTDKAVYPINAMGMTKALAEKLMIAKARGETSTIFCGVRYGNVMASRGSVIPLFIEKIKNGEDLPVTDPKMTRFLLSLDDAIDLVELAVTRGGQGDIFVRKAPAATVENLAKALVSIFNGKSKLKVIGTREGEKMHETLAHKFELQRAEELKDYFRIIPENSYYDYSKYFEKGSKTMKSDDYTSKNTRQLTIKEVEDLLLSLPYVQKELKGEKGEEY